MKQDKISLPVAMLLNINVMVGAGIFIFPQIMAAKAGMWSFLGWPLVALIFLPLVLSIAEIARRFPGAGSFYNYSKSVLGLSAGFTSGWLYALAGIAIAAIHLNTIKTIITKEAGFHTLGTYPSLFYAGVIMLYVLLNTFSMRVVSFLQSLGTLFKLIPLFAVVVIAAIFFSQLPAPQIVGSTSLGALFETLPFALFGYWGFEACCNISHRIVDAKKNTFRAILLGFTGTMLIYTCFHLALLFLMGPATLAEHGVRALPQFLPLTSPILHWFSTALFKSAITMAHITVLAAMFTTGSNLLQAMAAEGILFCSNILRRLNTQAQPVPAILFQGVLIFLFVTLIDAIPALVAITNLGLLAAFVFTLVSLFILQKREGAQSGLYKTILAFISCGILGYYSYLEIGTLSNLQPLIVLIAAGWCLYVLRPYLPKALA